MQKLKGKKEYAILDAEKNFVLSYGYYGNSDGIPLYTKLGAKHQIVTYYLPSYSIKKMKIKEANPTPKKEDK